jgi:hypothetical protein
MADVVQARMFSPKKTVEQKRAENQAKRGGGGGFSVRRGSTARTSFANINLDELSDEDILERMKKRKRSSVMHKFGLVTAERKFRGPLRRRVF